MLISPFCLLLKTLISYHFSCHSVTFPFHLCFWKLTPKTSDKAECWAPCIASETGGIQSLPAPDLKGGLCLQKEALVCALISDISGQPHQGKSLTQKGFSLQRQNNDVSLEMYDSALSFTSPTIYSYCFCHIQVKFNYQLGLGTGIEESFQVFPKSDNALVCVLVQENIFLCLRYSISYNYS